MGWTRSDLKVRGAGGIRTIARASDGSLFQKNVLITPDANAINACDLFNLAVPIEALSAGTDITARPIFVVPTGYTLTLTNVSIITQAAPVGIDAGNTMVLTVAKATNAIVTKTYNNTVVLPTADADNLGALSATHKVLPAGSVVKLTITNGTTAAPPALTVFLTGLLVKA